MVWAHLTRRITIRLSGNIIFALFAGVLCHHTETFWIQLKAFLNEHYHIFVRGAYGTESALTAVQKKAGWVQVNMAFRQCLQDLHEARLGAFLAHELVKQGNLKEVDTRYVTAMLMSHRVMQDYMDA